MPMGEFYQPLGWLGNPSSFYKSPMGLNHGSAQLTIERLEEAPATAALHRPEGLARTQQ